MNQLGCFTTSLTVKDITVSKKFYETLGFSVFHGAEEQGWLIMKNGSCNIGLFQGMFDKNIMTINPGWDQDAQAVGDFEDIRDIQNRLKSAGISIDQLIETDKGPANFTVIDPDGNPILFDQHV